ncbi:CHAT domain-containing protein [Aquimarina sp. MMG016]|uniref:CHAT domain-containing protein n=1 Tax=Aquimarina sp. MMG016 TaxID=2822690 RepID=UPI001B3A40BC|nr:CHAT domain-containing protein [Aquimarina sp. MMG016]MBQ4818835.1 CHAT domain-containing protein [Aquimarina sp. MMG016]
MYKNIIWLICLFGFIGFSQSKEEQLSTYFQKGSSFLYSDKDSLNYYFDKSIKLCKELSDVNSEIMILFYRVGAYGYHYDLELLKQNLDKIDAMINDNRVSGLINDVEAVTKNYLVQKGNYNFKVKNYTGAKEVFLQLEDILSSVSTDSMAVDDRTLLFSTYNYLASISELTNKNDLAKEYFYKSFRLEKEGEIQHANLRIQGTKTRLARVYENEKSFVKANELLHDALAFYSSGSDNPKIKNNLLSVHQRLSKNYLLQDSIQNAIRILKEGEQYYAKNDAFARSADLLYGDIYLSDKQFIKAEEYYQSYLSGTKLYRNDQKHQDIAEALARIGKLYTKQKDFDKSLGYYQQALMQLSVKFNNDDFNENPNPKEVSSKLELIKILKQKLEVLHQAFISKNDVKYLRSAIINSYGIIETLDVLKPEFESKVDKQFLITEMYPAFHSMVEIAYVLYDQTKDRKYIEDAFHFMEKSKSTLLLEAARNAQASLFEGIPENILSTEQQYRANIIHLEKKLFSKGRNNKISDSLFKVKNEYYGFIENIEQEYPRYHDLKYDTQVVELIDVQNLLDSDTGLISYFSTDTDVFAITIQKNSFEFYKLPFGHKIKNEILSFYSDVSNVKSSKPEEFLKTGNSVYKNILEKPLQYLHTKTLIILRDDILNYVPFEALPKNSDQPSYLIQDYQISYAESATLLQEYQKGPDSKRYNLLAFAPSFGEVNSNVQEERSDFGPLLYNMEEVKNIANYFKGEVILGDKASIEFFSNNSQQYNILHFATHAATNDENPDYSYLAFSEKDNSTHNLLYVKDLYAHRVDADLVTLSACETGLGKLQRGEGMLSLARGFNYAGAKSLVTTLWKVNDQTTAELMNDFYKNLSDNMPKDKALREAKLKYLASTDDDMMKHPYYWSAFMISGNMTPIGNQTSQLWWLLMLVPIAIILIRKLRNS